MGQEFKWQDSGAAEVAFLAGYAEREKKKCEAEHQQLGIKKRDRPLSRQVLGRDLLLHSARNQALHILPVLLVCLRGYGLT